MKRETYMLLKSYNGIFYLDLINKSMYFFDIPERKINTQATGNRYGQ